MGGATNIVGRNENGSISSIAVSSEGHLRTDSYIVDSSGDAIKIDDITRALTTIDYEHHEIHEGDYFRCGYQKNIPGAGTSVFVITTPNTTKWLHFRPAVDVEIEANIKLYENPTSVTGGTAIIPKNANRNSNIVSGATCVHTPSAYNTTGAVILGNTVIGSGKTNGGGTESFEWILKQNTKYILEVTNRSSNTANEVNIRLNWYEHTNS